MTGNPLSRVLPGLFVLIAALFAARLAAAPHLMENLGRGVVAVPTGPAETFVSWRLLGTEPAGIAFNLYRTTGGGSPVLLNATPLTGATSLADPAANLAQSTSYFVRAVLGGVEQPASAAFTLPAGAPVQPYLRLPLQRPAGGTTPDNVTFTYSPNDCSVGDLDGDGEYEIIVKWDPSNAQDNSFSGYTGNVLVDAYRLDGTLLWRIDLGRNIRAGAHYTQFLVYDFDGDGRAEFVAKTAPATRDGTGTFIGQPGRFTGTPSAPIDHNADYRNSSGYILTGPEFFTVFDGLTGAELATTNYVVPRTNNPASGDVTAWGDNYGNRVDRFLAGVAYLDGRRPSLVLCRGYYTRAVLAAWDWRDGQLTQRWVFDTGHTGTASPFSSWRGQGAHSLTIGDVDGDGRDEITYGAAAIDDDGSGLYSTLLGHGDALHLSDMDPTRPGQEVWMVHEDPGSYGPNGLEFRDARTGALIFGVSGQGADIGRGVAGDIDPRHLGYEMWGTRGGLMTASGAQVSTARPPQINFMIWWDGDLLREILDGTTISKWDWNTSVSSPLFAPSGVSSNNGTKANPALSADLFGDWREEVIFRESTNDALRIYTTTLPTTHRLPTLMHDRQYRLAIAWQNVAYNQPPHPGYYLGDGMSAPPPAPIVTSLAALGPAVPAVDSVTRYDPVAAATGATSVVFRVTFATPVTGVDAGDFLVTTTGSVTGTVTNVTAHTSLAYNVTVGAITGTGTIGLDLAAAGTGITGPGGVPVAGGFTTGATYTRATLAWTNPASGGLWSNPANWDGGVVADGVGAVPTFGNFDLLADNTVILDTPRTLSGLVLGDTNTASPASWTISDAGNPAGELTLAVVSGVPTITVNALGAGATASLAVNLAGSGGLAKSGAGTLVLTRPGTPTGQISVNAGILRLADESVFAASTVNVSAGTGQLDVNGGALTATGNTTVNGSGGVLVVNAGSATLAAVATNNSANGLIRVNGGVFSATSINLPRSSDATPSFASGFVVTGGDATVTGTVGIGTNNSWGSMSVEGGTLLVGGAVTVGNQTTAGRGGQLRVTGGTFTATNSADGVILARRAANTANATFSGGVSTVARFKLGFDSTVNSGTATLTINGGAVYVGAGGIARNGAGTFVSTVNLQGGLLGASAPWSAAVPLSLPAGGNIALHTADAAGTPADITLSGVLSGAGGFTKSGAGVLTLAAANTFAGPVAVNAGTLRLTGSLAAGDPLTVNAGATLTGNGTAARALALAAGGAIAPAPVLAGASLAWQAGGTLDFDLGATADQINLAGALTKAGSGGWGFRFAPSAGVAAGSAWTLLNFGSTTFTSADFTATGLPAGLAGRFAIETGRLTLTLYGPPAITSAAAASGVFGAPLSFAVTATNSPTGYSATGLPPGLAIDPVTGVIAGTAAAAGVFHATVEAANAAGTTAAPLVFTIAKAPAAVTLAGLAATYDGQPHPATVTTLPNGLAVVVTYDGGTAAPVNAGSYHVVATVAEPNFAGGASAPLVISPAHQSITFPAPGDRVFGDPAFALGATASSGLPVAYIVVGGPAIVNGSTVTLTGAGSVTIAATQPGNSNYHAAAAVERTFTVARGVVQIDLAGLRQAYDGTPRVVTATTTPAGLPVALTYAGVSAAPTLPGAYPVVATVDTADYYDTAAGTLEVSITALVRQPPTLNGEIEGSLQVLTAGSFTLNGNAMITGDLLVPGTPTVRLNGKPVLGGVQDGAGAATPSSHTVTLNGNALVRYIVRRTDPLALPVVPAPLPPAGTRDVALNGAGQSAGDFATVRNLTLNGNAGPVAVPPGAYGTFTANGNTGFVLGLAGTTEPTVYHLQRLTLNGNTTLSVAGPVILRVDLDVVLNGSAGSATAGPSALRLEIHRGGLTLNGNATLHGHVAAPVGTVTINANTRINGNVAADRLILNGNALLAEATP